MNKNKGVNEVIEKIHNMFTPLKVLIDKMPECITIKFSYNSGYTMDIDLTKIERIVTGKDLPINKTTILAQRRKEIKKEYYNRNAKKISEYYKKYYLKNRLHMREVKKKWYEVNKKRLKEKYKMDAKKKSEYYYRRKSLLKA